jgi:hypothetical protein
MRRISKSEFRLLAIFGAAIFLTVNLVALRAAMSAVKGNTAEIASLRTKAAEYEDLLKESEYWQARGLWRESNPLPVFDESVSDSEFVEQIQSSLTAQGLKIDEQQLSPAERKAGFVAIGVTLKVSGSLESLIKWVSDVQKAGKFIEIQSFALKATDQSSTMVANLKLAKYFTPFKPASAP